MSDRSAFLHLLRARRDLEYAKRRLLLPDQTDPRFTSVTEDLELLLSRYALEGSESSVDIEDTFAPELMGPMLDEDLLKRELETFDGQDEGAYGEEHIFPASSLELDQDYKRQFETKSRQMLEAMDKLGVDALPGVVETSRRMFRFLIELSEQGATLPGVDQKTESSNDSGSDLLPGEPPFTDLETLQAVLKMVLPQSAWKLIEEVQAAEQGMPPQEDPESLEAPIVTPEELSSTPKFPGGRGQDPFEHLERHYGSWLRFFGASRDRIFLNQVRAHDGGLVASAEQRISHEKSRKGRVLEVNGKSVEKLSEIIPSALISSE